MENIGLEAVFDMQQFDKGIASYLFGVKRATSETENTQGSFGKAFDDMGKRVLNVAGIMSGVFVAGVAAAGAAVGAFAAKGITGAMDLESQMGAIAAVMGETKDAVEPLKNLIFDLGLDPTLKVNAEQAADAIEKLASNGLTMTEVMEGAAKATVLLANSTDADFDTAAAIATDTMALFNIKAADMMDAVNGITGVTVASKFTINDYRLALAQAGGVASATGVSFSDFNTSIAGMSNFFASGSDAGTSFKTMLQRLIPSTAASAEAMSEIGLTTVNASAALEYLSNKGVKPVSDDMYDLYNQAAQVFYATHDLEVGSEAAAEKFNKWAVETGLVQSAFYDQNGAMRDMDEISVLLNKSLAGLTEQEKSAALSTIFGTDAMRAAVGMAQQGEVAYTDQALAAKELGLSYDSLTEAMEGGLTKFEILAIRLGNTDAAEAAKVRMDNFKGSLEILQGVIDTVSLKIGFAFLPMLKEMADRLAQFVSDNSAGIIVFFENLATVITEFVTGTPGDFPWEDIFPPWLAETMYTISSLVEGLGQTISDFRSGAMSADYPWETVFPGTLGTIINLIADNMDILTGALGGIAALLASAGIAAAFAAIGAAIAAILSPMGLAIIAAGALGAAWNTNFLGIKDMTLAVIEPIQNFIAVVADAGLNSIETQEALTLFPSALQGIIGWTIATVTTIQNYISAIQDAGVFSIEAREALTLFPEALQGIIGGIVETVASIANYISSIQDAGLFSSEAGEALGLLVESFTGLITSVGEQLAGWTAVLTEWALQVGVSLLEVDYAAIGQAIVDALMLGWTTAVEAVGPSVVALGDKISTTLTSVDWGALGTSILEFIGAGWSLAVTAFGPAIKEFTDSISTTISGVDWGAVGKAILDAIGAGWKLAVATVGPTITGFTDLVKTTISGIDWGAVGKAIIAGIQAGWEAAKTAASAVLTTIITAWKTNFGDSAQNWLQVGKDVLVKIQEGFEAAREATLTAISTIATAVKDRYLTPQGFDWNTLGQDIQNAIRDGLSMAAEAASGIIAVALTVATAIKDQFTEMSWSEVGALISDIISEGFTQAAKAAEGLIASAGQIGLDLVKSFSEINWEEVGRSIARFIKEGFKAIAEGVGGLVEAARTIATESKDSFSDVDWLQLGKDILTAIGTGVKAIAYGAGGLIYIVAEIVKGFTEELFSVSWSDQGDAIMQAIQDGIENAKAAFMEVVRTIPAEMKKIFTDMIETWKNIGRDIVNGIGAGLLSARDSLMEKAQDLANSLPGWVKTVLGISSPSKVFMEIGKNIIEGLVAGIDGNASKVRSSLESVANSVIPWFKLMEMEFSTSTDFTERLLEQMDNLKTGLQSTLDRRRVLSEAITAVENQLNTGAFGSEQQRQNLLKWLGQARTELAFINNMGEVKLLEQLSQITFQNNEIDEFNKRMQSQITLLTEAKKLGVDVTGVQVGDFSIEGLKTMAALEREILEIKKRQLWMQAESIKNSREETDAFIAQRQTISNIELFNERTKTQLDLMQQAVDLGIDLSRVIPNNRLLIDGSIDSERILLGLQQSVAEMTGQNLRDQIFAMHEEQKRVTGLASALKQLQPLIDQTDVSSAFGQRYKATVLDPILNALEQAAGIDSERLRLMNEYTRAAERLVEIRRKEEQLGFLQQQLDVVKMIQDQDLVGGASLFDGIRFGVDASIDDLLTLTNRVLNAMIEETRDELGIHSPSSVFAEIGSQMMAGLAQGIQANVIQPFNSLRSAVVDRGAVTSRSINLAMGGVNIYNGMDEVMFESKVLRLMERAI